MLTHAQSSGWVQRLVRLTDTLTKHQIIIKNTAIADKYLKCGWQFQKVTTEYWATDLLGSFDSCFVYHLENKSWIFRFVGERINRYIFKRPISIWRWATSTNVQQNPTIPKHILNRTWCSNIRLFFSKTFKLRCAHNIEKRSQPNGPSSATTPSKP